MNKLFMEKCVIPGWAGEMNREEYLYLRNILANSKRTLKKWDLNEVRLTEKIIREKAKNPSSENNIES